MNPPRMPSTTKTTDSAASSADSVKSLGRETASFAASSVRFCENPHENDRYETKREDAPKPIL